LAFTAEAAKLGDAMNSIRNFHPPERTHILAFPWPYDAAMASGWMQQFQIGIACAFDKRRWASIVARSTKWLENSLCDGGVSV